MKKILILAAAATMMVSCYQTETINREIDNEAAPTVIGFNTFSEKATRANEATELDLEYYHKTFSVYSTKKSNNTGAIEVVFNGDDAADIITFDANRLAPNNWTYSPYRYWDKQATYAFVAVAPNSDIVKYSKSDNVADNAGTFITASATGYTLTGQNLQPDTTTTAEIRKGFDGKDGNDTDLMTSGKITRDGAAEVTDVNLEFKHILAKLNIAIAKDPTFDNVKVIIKKVQVVGLDDNGTYYEGTSDTESAWTSSKVDATYTLLWENVDGIELPGSTDQGAGQKRYFIESLVMPQSIEQDVEKLIIDYTIVTETREERYNYELKFDDGQNKVFESFLERNNYSINLTVRPNVITFDASATLWVDNDAQGTVVPVTPLP